MATATSITLEKATKIGDEVIALARKYNFKPMGVCVFNSHAQLLFFKLEDGNPLFREAIARSKAVGALGFGMDSSSMVKVQQDRPGFMQSLISLAHPHGGLAPVPGGVLIVDPKTNQILGAVGVSGDTSDNDEKCAIEAIIAAGFTVTQALKSKL